MENQEASIAAEPKLWNPNAAANWSLLFTPILGAWLHAKNWEALSQWDKARKSMMWVYVGFAFFVGVIFLPDSVGTLPGFIFIIAWYFTIGKKQATYLRVNSIKYQKRPWKKPLLIGAAGFIVYVAIGGCIISVMQPSTSKILEKESVSLVTSIVQKQLGEKTACKTVAITNESPKGFYNGVAYMDNGKELKITIEVKGEQMLVSIPNP